MANNEIKIVVKGENKSKGPVTEAKKDVQDLTKEIGKVPDKKVINIQVKDDATAGIKKVDDAKLSDKNVKVTADDKASGEIAAIAKKEPPPVKVKVQADNTMGDIGGKFKELGKGGAGAFVGGFTGGIVGGGLVDIVTGAFSEAIAKSGEKKHIAANLQNQMGITPEQAQAYGDRVGKMFWGGIGDSKDQISGAFSTLSSDVKGWSSMTTDAQDKIVKGATKVSSAFKLDINEPIRAASTMVTSKFMPSWEGAFDLITTGYQTLGSRGGDAIDTLNEYSGYFQKLGITAPQALGLISQGLQAGAMNTDKVADAWKEFGIRIIDGSQGTSDALKALGLNSKKTIQEIAEGGPKAEADIEKIIKKIQGIKKETDRNKIGVALFGTQWEDTMRGIIGSVDPAAAKMQEFAGATEKLSDTVVTEGDRFSRRWDEAMSQMGDGTASFGNNVITVLENVGGAINDTFGVDVEKAKNQAQLAEVAMGGFATGIDGTNRAFLTMVDSLGGPGTQAFKDTMLNISETQLAAQGVTLSFDKLGNRVLTMPDGKPIIIDHNTGAVISGLDTLAQKINKIPDGFFTVYMDSVVRSAPPSNMAPMPFGHAGGGPIQHASSGGARGMARINEGGHRELSRSPDGTIVDPIAGSTIIPAGQSAQIMSGAAGGGGAGGGGGGELRLHLDVSGIEGPATRMIVDILRGSLRASGTNGDVKRWLT